MGITDAKYRQKPYLKGGETKLTEVKWNNQRIVNKKQNKPMKNKRI